MNIKFTGDVGEPDPIRGIANKRASDGLFDSITVCVCARDSDEADSKINSSEHSGTVEISPAIAVIDKAVMNQAIARLRTQKQGNYATVEALLTADITFKQGKDSLEEFVYADLT